MGNLSACVAQLVRVYPCQGWGCGFESRHALILKKTWNGFFNFNWKILLWLVVGARASRPVGKVAGSSPVTR